MGRKKQNFIIKPQSELFSKIQKSLKQVTDKLDDDTELVSYELDSCIIDINENDIISLFKLYNTTDKEPYSFIDYIAVYAENGEFYDNIPVQYIFSDDGTPDKGIVYIQKSIIIIELSKERYGDADPDGDLICSIMRSFVISEVTRRKLIYIFKILLFYHLLKKTKEAQAQTFFLQDTIQNELQLSKMDKNLLIQLCKTAIKFYCQKKNIEYRFNRSSNGKSQ